MYAREADAMAKSLVSVKACRDQLLVMSDKNEAAAVAVIVVVLGVGVVVVVVVIRRPWPFRDG